jgi:hypothetical protein
MLQIDNLTVTIGSKLVCRDLSLTVAGGVLVHDDGVWH